MCNNKRRLYFKNIYKTLVRLEQLERSRTKVKNLQALTCCFLCYPKTLELNRCVGNEQWNRTRRVVIYTWIFVSSFGINIIIVVFCLQNLICLCHNYCSTATCLCLKKPKKELTYTLDGLINREGRGGAYIRNKYSKNGWAYIWGGGFKPGGLNVGFYGSIFFIALTLLWS